MQFRPYTSILVVALASCGGGQSASDNSTGISQLESSGTDPAATLGEGSRATALAVSASVAGEGSSVADSAAGLTAEYFSNAYLSGRPLIRTDSTVNFTWGGGGPASVPSDNFSVRWTGFLTVAQSGIRTICTTSDDGVRLWIDESSVVDRWTDHAATRDCKDVSLTAGPHAIRLEYYERSGDATMQLQWSQTGVSGLAAIPAAAFSHSGAEGDTVASPRAPSVQPLSARTAIVSWIDATSDETGFIVERRQGEGAVWQQVGPTLAADTTTFKDTSLTAQTRYEYRISAVRPSGRTPPSLVASAVTPSATTQTIFFVSDSSGADSNPGTEDRPWKTIQRANDQAQPGQTFLVRSGTYTSSYYAAVAINRSGTANAWITYKAYPGERPKIKSTIRKNIHSIEIRTASYIVIDGFDIEGHTREVTLEGAMAEMRNPTAYASSSGITIESRDLSKPISHHIIIRNNNVFDHPLSGISVLGGDYVTVENNLTTNNGRYSSYGGSGISILNPRNSDNNTTAYRFVVSGNISSENINKVPCGCISYRQPTDGNGIILDTFDKNAYAGKTLVVNNIVKGNGGRGIHMLNSGNADVFFNTTRYNSTEAITGEGEITVIGANSKNVRVFNNILVARSDRPLNSTRGAGVVSFDHNVLFGGNSFTSTGATGNIVADPQFGTNWTVLQTSPAVDAAFTGVAVPVTDFARGPRPRGSGADIGAVESW